MHSQSLEKPLTHHGAPTCTTSIRGTTQSTRYFVDIQMCNCMPRFGSHFLVLFQVSFLHCPFTASIVIPQKQ